MFPDGLSVAPYMDGGGLSALGVNEVLLQSHNGLIRVLPAASRSWSGQFRLRTEGSFLVAVDFERGSARLVEVRSLHGGNCRIQNPWNETCTVCTPDRVVARSNARVIEFSTQRGCVYVLSPDSRPLSGYSPAPIEDQANQQAGLPGRVQR